MYIDINKHAAGYIAVLIEKRISFLKNKILKEKGDDWYDYEPSQIHMKICDESPEYFRLSNEINEFYKIDK